MKKLALLFAATTVTLTVVFVSQRHKIASQQTRLASLDRVVEQKSKQIESVEASEKRANRQVHELLRQTDDLAAQAQARQQAEVQAQAAPPTNLLAAAASSEIPTPASEAGKQSDDKSGFGKLLSKMMQDPQTKKFIRDQQRMMMDQLYAPLVNQMALAPDESEKFKDLLADNAMKATEKASSLLGGASSTNQAEALTALSTDQKSFEDEVKAFLGEERYSFYKEYQQTVGDRMQLNQFKQMAGAENPFSGQQTEQLLAIMKEEKQGVTAAMGQSFPGQDPSSLQAMFSNEQQIEKLLQSQETVNERVFQRAGQVLSPDQLASFGKFQTNQMQMMRMGMTMARKFFGQDKSENEVTH